MSLPQSRFQPASDHPIPATGDRTTTIFVGGSRSIAHVPDAVRARLTRIAQAGHAVVVGDASGADEAVQAHLGAACYDRVTVFCSGNRPRNNIGAWPVRRIAASGASTGFQFHAAKDRAMAREAVFGLMVWDGRSPGSVLNVLRLAQAGRIAVLVNLAEGVATNVRSAADWQTVLARCGTRLRHDLRVRATPEERRWLHAAG